jgi:PTH1 family peptidyl-tRNA hydrolase
MTLIVGLGNPTDKYKNNRHNIGFMAVDRLLKSNSFTDISKSRFKGELYKKNSLLLLKPHTYMNLSGESVQAVCNYYKIDIEDVIVIHDELDISFGRIKIKRGGSSGGHNGLKSIDKHCQNNYLRVRVGIGKPQNKDVIAHVLSDFSKDESECLEKLIDISAKLSLELLQNDLKDVQNSFSSKKSLC